MANEIQIRTQLSVRKGKLDYRSNPSTFQVTMETESPRGGTPGNITVPLDGVEVNLTALTTPGYCWMQNLDTTNYVEYGVRDPGTGSFYPLGELYPGEPQILHLSRNLLEAYTNLGTGTTGSVNQFWMKANTAACEVLVHAFEK